MPEPGDVILTRVKFADGSGSKIRPALVLFEELGNVVEESSMLRIEVDSNAVAEHTILSGTGRISRNKDHFITHSLMPGKNSFSCPSIYMIHPLC